MRLTRGQILNGPAGAKMRRAIATAAAEADAINAAQLPASALVVGMHSKDTGTRMLLTDGTVLQGEDAAVRTPE